MRIFTTTLATLVLLTSYFHACSQVYLTGSTSCRPVIFAALADNNGDSGAVFMKGTISYGTWGNANPQFADYMVFKGILTNAGADNGQPVAVDCAWSSSEAGFASAAGTTITNFLRDGSLATLYGSPQTWVDISSAVTTVGGNVQAGEPGFNGSPQNGAQFEGFTRIANLVQTVTSQAYSWTPAIPGGSPAAKLTQLVAFGSEGAVPIVFSRNVNPNPSHDWLDCSNITLPQLYVMFANGLAPAWFISGKTNDQMICYLVGRNLGSGVRMSLLFTSTYDGHRAMTQYSIGYGVDPHDPAQSVTTLLLQNEGLNGYQSGNGVAKALANTGGSSTSGSCQEPDPINPGTNWFAIGYLTPAEALNTGNNGGQTPPLYCNTNNWITLDGVFENNHNVENGTYWLWGNAYLYGQNGISGIQSSVGNTLCNAVIGQLNLLGYGVNPNGHDLMIPYSLMNVTKSSDQQFPSF